MACDTLQIQNYVDESLSQVCRFTPIRGQQPTLAAFPLALLGVVSPRPIVHITPLNMLLPIRKCLNGSVQSGSIVHLLSLAIPQAARSAQVVAGHIHCDENTEEAKQLREKQ